MSNNVRESPKDLTTTYLLETASNTRGNDLGHGNNVKYSWCFFYQGMGNPRVKYLSPLD